MDFAKRTVAVALAGAAFAAAGSATAQWTSEGTYAGEGVARVESREGFGRRSDFVFSVENVLGFYELEVGSEDSKGNVPTSTLSTTGFLPPLGGGRLGFHTVAPSGLTAGVLVSANQVTRTTDQSSDKASFLLFGVGPRVGYAAPINRTFGLWGRVGPTWFHADSSSTDSKGNTDDDPAWNTIALSVEGYFVVTPVPHFGVMIGPGLDFNLWGKVGEDRSNPNNPTPSRKASIATKGLMAGLFADF